MQAEDTSTASGMIYHMKNAQDGSLPIPVPIPCGYCRGSVETWSTKDLAMDAMTKGKHRLLSLIDGMGSHWWSARTGKVAADMSETSTHTSEYLAGSPEHKK